MRVYPDGAAFRQPRPGATGLMLFTPDVAVGMPHHQDTRALPASNNSKQLHELVSYLPWLNGAGAEWSPDQSTNA
ncbi:hypothetical protein [Spirosoma arcticum]